MGIVSQRAKYKYLLTSAVASLYLAACLLPGFWGRGGFLDGGTEVPGWALVLGLPPLCCISWPSLAATIISAQWLWQDRLRPAFILACINILPAVYYLPAYWLPMPRKFELRIGYYLWLAAVVVWAVGVGCFRWRDQRQGQQTSKPKHAMDDLQMSRYRQG
jgi:4-amino-4-deoxy-L-arabinose transferase-like glycosyltransferase